MALYTQAEKRTPVVIWDNYRLSDPFKHTYPHTDRTICTLN
ncbi:Uncharacterised protein [Hafnia alvei]|uniref:Uncharacterized protein n=1 Tax=Hafnia alvei TaxID=569 RepID=A0A377PU80_HAFAL|nr:Uncharacterised protein [Hafnia alvei]